MTKITKQTLILLLISSLALLPLRAAYAMYASNMNNSGIASDHCKDMDMDMSHDMTSMPSTDNNQTNNSDCCDNCDDGCNDCVNTVSFINTDTIQTNNHQSQSFYRFSSNTFLSQELSPPTKPPLPRFI